MFLYSFLAVEFLAPYMFVKPLLFLLKVESWKCRSGKSFSGMIFMWSFSKFKQLFEALLGWISTLTNAPIIKYIIIVIITVTILSHYRRGLDWWLDLLNSYRSVTTSNFNRFTNSRTLQFNRARIKSSQSAVFTNRCLVATSNGRRYRYSGFPNCPRASATRNNNRSQRPTCSSPLTAHQFTSLHCTQLNSLH
jgi:hypothetical protein